MRENDCLEACFDHLYNDYFQKRDNVQKVLHLTSIESIKIKDFNDNYLDDSANENVRDMLSKM